MKSILIRIYYLLKAGLLYSVARVSVHFLPLKDNKFFCMSMSGYSYGDNMKYLSEYIKKKDPNTEIVWSFAPNYFKIVDCNCKKVELYSFRYYIEILTSKYILSNCTINRKMLIKRKGQIYLQTWHGTALKKIGYDISRQEDKYWFDRKFRPDSISYDRKMVDIWASGSKFMSKIYREKFLYSGEIVETGTPRNDVFFGDNYKTERRKVRTELGVNDDTELILYAPTFRHDNSMIYYDIDLAKLKEEWYRKIGKKSKIFVRLHPRLQSLEHEFIEKLNTDFTSVTMYPDMQGLLCATDLLVTDYSSSMFDFMYSFKPVIMYVPDRYSYFRGFYFNLDELPFVLVNNNEELVDKVRDYKEPDYKSRLKEFMKQIGSVEDGTASAQIYKILISKK